MTPPRIRTWAETSTRWWLIVDEGPSEVRFGPYRKAGMVKGLDEHIRSNAARHGWDAAVRAGEKEVVPC